MHPALHPALCILIFLQLGVGGIDSLNLQSCRMTAQWRLGLRAKIPVIPALGNAQVRLSRDSQPRISAETSPGEAPRIPNPQHPHPEQQPEHAPDPSPDSRRGYNRGLQSLPNPPILEHGLRERRDAESWNPAGGGISAASAHPRGELAEFQPGARFQGQRSSSLPVRD